MRRASYAALAVVAIAGMAGCASVSVQKVDPVTGKVYEGAAEGLRFYLPRPYVSVFEPFIVGSEVYLASGEMSPDSQFVLLTDVPPGLAKLVNGKLATGQQKMGALRIDAAQVTVPKATKAGPQGAAVVDEAGQASAPEAAASGASAPAPDAKAKAANGVLNYKSINDVNAYAVTPQPRYFNVLWLPDFDEQYVVTAKAGLGNAGVLLGFGQGWSLQSLDASIDNSALAKPLLDFYAGTIGALQKVATAQIEGPLAALSGGPQGAAVANARTFSGGTPVTLKVTKVRIVAPGLYPILKPKEMDAAHLKPEDSTRILAPVKPFTNIAFNTYDVVVIEAAKTSGDSALRIQQYVDSAGPSAASGGSDEASSTARSMSSAGSLNGPQNQLNVALSQPENVTVAKAYFLASLTQAAGVVKVVLKKQTAGSAGTLQALPDDASIKAKVIAILGAAQVSVEAANITVVR